MDIGAELRSEFVKAWGERGRGAEEAQVEGLLDLYERGQAVWPGMACAPAAFAGHVASCLPMDEEAGGALGRLHGEDLYLAVAALGGDRAAQQEVDRQVQVQARAAAGRVSPDPDFAAEVAQLLLERLLVPRDGGRPRLHDYAGHGPLGALLRVASMRTALNLRQGSGRTVALDEESLAAVSEAADVETRYLRTLHQEAFRQALREAFTGLPRELRQVVRMHHGRGLSGQAIGRMLQVDRTTVMRWLARARAALLSETRRLLQEGLRLPRVETDSLISVLCSQHELSLGGRMTTGDDP